jgi:predicted enzyme related to lactoylglutathione lyase
VKHHERGDLYYFTLPTKDLARAETFFGAVLGWQFADDPEQGHIGNISAPPGGLRAGHDTYDLWFAVDDITAAVELVRAQGGTSTEPVLYDSGWAAECTDDQGTRFCLSVPADKYTR